MSMISIPLDICLDSRKGRFNRVEIRGIGGEKNIVYSTNLTDEGKFLTDNTG